MTKLTAEGAPSGIYMTYYANHLYPTQGERIAGINLGALVDRGFKVHFPNTSRVIKISTHKLGDVGIEEHLSLARRIIQRRLGPTQQEVPVY